MKQKLKDFIEIFLFGFVIFSALNLIALGVINFFKYLGSGNGMSIDFNLRFVFSFEVLIVTLCATLGLVYIYVFKKYKNEPDERREKRD